jgi:putative transposase
VSVCQHIAQRRHHVPVRQRCHVLGVAPSACCAGYRQQHRRVLEPARQAAVRQALARHGRRYGTRHLRAKLHAEGYAVGRWRIGRTLVQHGLRAQQPRSFVPRTTDSTPAVRAAPNRLLGQPAPTAPNRVWAGDITY